MVLMSTNVECNVLRVCTEPRENRLNAYDANLPAYAKNKGANWIVLDPPVCELTYGSFQTCHTITYLMMITSAWARGSVPYVIWCNKKHTKCVEYKLRPLTIIKQKN